MEPVAPRRIVTLPSRQVIASIDPTDHSVSNEFSNADHSLLYSVTRTRRVGDRDHVGLANGTAAPEEHLPRFFGKANYTDTAPSVSKKQGGGKGNW
jgi:hypothetical protein